MNSGSCSQMSSSWKWASSIFNWSQWLIVWDKRSEGTKCHLPRKLPVTLWCSDQLFSSISASTIGGSSFFSVPSTTGFLRQLRAISRLEPSIDRLFDGSMPGRDTKSSKKSWGIFNTRRASLNTLAKTGRSKKVKNLLTRYANLPKQSSHNPGTCFFFLLQCQSDQKNQVDQIPYKKWKIYWDLWKNTCSREGATLSLTNFVMAQKLPCSLMKFAWYLLHNSLGAFCAWVKALSNDFSTELTGDINVLVTYSLDVLF